MKKVLIILIALFINVGNIYAIEKQVVILNKCVDGDTAWFNLNNKTIKTRFLAIDTPESTNKIEEYGKEASEFTCNLLTNASAIEIEYDENSDKTDKYDRHLVWVFVDNELLQEKIIENGLAEVAYLYGDYKYTSILEKAEDIAKKNKLNIWSNSEDTNYTLVIISIIIIVSIFIFSKKGRKKIINKVEKELKKKLKSKINNL